VSPVTAHDSLLVEIIKTFIGQVTVMGPVALGKLLGALSDLEGEAQAHADDVYRQLLSKPGDGSYAEGLAETAHEAGVAHFAELKTLKQSITNLLAAGLFHLFKQQRAEYRKYAKIRGVAPFQFGRLSRWPKIKELTLVANTVKHGEGPASDGLRKIRGDLFGYFDLMWEDPVTAPLAGEGLYLKEDDIREYADAIITLWREVAAQHGA
jgi:hypothetical protein